MVDYNPITIPYRHCLITGLPQHDPLQDRMLVTYFGSVQYKMDIEYSVSSLYLDLLTKYPARAICIEVTNESYNVQVLADDDPTNVHHLERTYFFAMFQREHLAQHIENYNDNLDYIFIKQDKMQTLIQLYDYVLIKN